MRTLLLALLIGTSCTAQTVPDFGPVDALIADSLDQIGGGATVLVMQNGKVLHRSGYGSFSASAIRLTASGAKWLSGGVIASLLSDGSLTLDDSLAQFFPRLEGAKRAITVRQLFAHTSGLPGSEGTRSAPCLGQQNTTLAACAESILAMDLEAEPGAAFAYGGNSMQVAGRVAEIATGESWVDLFEARIAAPLGLSRTAYTRTTNPRISGGMITSADEYGTYLQMLLNGGVHDGQTILAPEAVDALLADQTQGAPVVYSPFTAYDGYPGLAPASSIRYGIGVWREHVAPDGTLLEASSPGAFGLCPWIDTERQLVGVLLVQDRLPDVVGTYLELKRLVRDIVDSLPVGSVPPSPSAQIQLDAPVPNPVQNQIRIAYTLTQPVTVHLALFDALGRRAALLEQGPRPAGSHQRTVDVRGLAPGMYRVVLLADGIQAVRPLLVTR